MSESLSMLQSELSEINKELKKMAAKRDRIKLKIKKIEDAKYDKIQGKLFNSTKGI